MLIVCAKKTDEPGKYNWKNYEVKNQESAEEFQKGIKALFDRSQQRLVAMRKVACRSLRDRDVVINM